MFVQTLIACAMERIIRDTDGNVISERPIGEIEIIRPPFRCVLKRNGQEDANKGNRVVVQCMPFAFNDSEIYEFDMVFWGFKAEVWNRRDSCTCFLEKDFTGDTWKEAFENAEVYFNEGCDKYEYLVFEREQALKNAE